MCVPVAADSLRTVRILYGADCIGDAPEVGSEARRLNDARTCVIMTYQTKRGVCMRPCVYVCVRAARARVCVITTM